ncbi:MAG TPA: APC family permease [Egibacteraceae bacterium]|nr:APC family permease [Egibacteraceae bacterium]
MSDTIAGLKRVVIGRPRGSAQLRHQLLPKWMALPVFSSDPLSSVAYATQEMMLVLAIAGTGAFGLVRPLSAAVAALLIIVVVSYRQTVRAYPQGGGAYRVSRENLGEVPGLVAAGALLIDYVLTVAVSTAAGVAAITSALPALVDNRVPIALAFLAFVMIANLRGVKEAGFLFALPTYGFVATILLLIGTGLVRCVGGCPQAPGPEVALQAQGALTMLLVLRAFSSGATALTGVEAISDGVQAFRYPQSRNAAATLAVMGALSVTMFLGISYLATATNVAVHEGMERTVVAQIALAVFGSGPLFLLVQIVTAAILILAANTAYADFPRLSSILASDRYLPRQLLARGDRLVFSNGILLLSSAAALLLIAFDASVTRLIQLYVVGVFTSFTLSQAGMVRRTRRLRQPGWRRGALVSGVGACVTGVVLVVVAVSKFGGGAWIVLLAIPSMVVLMKGISRHYQGVSVLLRTGLAEPEPTRPHHVVLVLHGPVDESVARAISYAQAVRPAAIDAVVVGPAHPGDVEQRWAELAADIPLRRLDLGETARRPARALRSALAEMRAERPDQFVSAVIPETQSHSWLELLRRQRSVLRLKAGLLPESGLAVTNVVSPDGGPGPYTVEEPVEHHVVVLVSAVHNATMRAIAYASSLEATSVRALSVNVDVERSNAMLQAWEDWGVQLPLELVDSPFRAVTETVRSYVRDFNADGRQTVVTCVLPEFVLPHWYHRPLHNQTALSIKAALLFERGIVVTNVPYRITADQSPVAEPERS